jgi:hypothetical protein
VAAGTRDADLNRCARLWERLRSGADLFLSMFTPTAGPLAPDPSGWHSTAQCSAPGLVAR